MSHHLDSPIARQDVRLDITDLYTFRGETGTVAIINVSHSLGEPPIPGFHPEGMYEFKFDVDGDAEEEFTYRFVFGEEEPPKVTPIRPSTTPGGLSDAEIIAKASMAANGSKFTALLAGDTSGYHSRSEAVAAFCGIVAV